MFVSGLQNELAVWEFLHNIVETLNEYFNKVVSQQAVYSVHCVCR
jgi:hypothetical protein